MSERPIDPLAERAYADAALERASRALDEVLQRLVKALDPFPGFEGMTTLQAIEVEAEGLQSPGRGCVVLCPDGQFYELELRSIPGPPEFLMGEDQIEELKPLEFTPAEHVAYAHAAIHLLADILEERGA